MARAVITKASWLSCSHGSAPVTSVGNNGLPAKLIVAGSAVMLAGDLAAATVSGCPQPTSSGSKPCSAVVSRTAGEASKLTVAGAAVLTDATAGATDGLPVPPPPATGFAVDDARQTKLKAV